MFFDLPFYNKKNNICNRKITQIFFFREAFLIKLFLKV